MHKKLIAAVLSLVLLSACSAQKQEQLTETQAAVKTQATTTAYQTHEQTQSQSVHSTQVPSATSPALKTTQKPTQKPVNKPTQAVEETDSVRAVWVTYYELKSLFSNGESGFKQKAQELIDNCVKNNINTVFLQVRPYFDAFYPSEIFEWSVYSLDKQGNPPDFDPLKIFVDLAHKKDIELHAWINPYRVSYDKEFEADKKYADFTVSCDEGVYLLPSREESRKLVLDGVREILNNYSVDGIHIDDYFYPTTSADFDSEDYKAYKNSGGSLGLTAWRQSNVNSLVSAMYSLVHSAKKGAVFSVSPAADIVKNKSVYFADVELWLREKGYADWIIPQIYFGFEHEKMPFLSVAAKWEKLASKGGVKLICGLAAYKSGTADELAGSGKDEWKENKNVIEKQIGFSLSSAKWCGYSLFSYGSML